MKRIALIIAAMIALHGAANAQPAAEAAVEEPGAQCWAIASAKIAPGSGYVPGKYTDVALSGGSGIEARADITVDASGKVVGVELRRPGRRFNIGDTLTASIGASGSGFSATVESLMNVPAAGKENDRRPPRCKRPGAAAANRALAAPPPPLPGMPMPPAGSR